MNIFFWIGLIVGFIFAWASFIEYLPVMNDKTAWQMFTDVKHSQTIIGLGSGILIALASIILIKLFSTQILAFLAWLKKRVGG